MLLYSVPCVQVRTSLESFPSRGIYSSVFPRQVWSTLQSFRGIRPPSQCPVGLGLVSEAGEIFEDDLEGDPVGEMFEDDPECDLVGDSVIIGSLESISST